MAIWMMDITTYICKKNGNIYTLLTIVKQYVYIWRYNRIL